MLKEGIYYFEYSLNNLDEFLDAYYINDNIIIDPEENREFLEEVNRLRELITTYCCLKENSIEDSIWEVVRVIEDLLLNVNNINYTEFVAYWKSLDTSFETFQEIPDRRKLLKELLDKFCERRRSLYDRYGYTNVSVQALYDSRSSSSKGQKFKLKIEDIVYNILGTKAKLTFINKKNWEIIRKDLNLIYKFGKSHQNKIPDFYIKYNNHHIIGEAKHIHNKGGAQDKQITELIEFIKQSEKNKNIHYLAFLDGLYLHYFKQDNLSEKIKIQKQNIEEALKTYKTNFFVNTEGLKKLLKDLKDD